MSEQLGDGSELPLAQFAKSRSEAKYAVASGSIVYLTENGRRRMALVPVEVAEAELQRRGHTRSTGSTGAR